MKRKTILKHDDFITPPDSIVGRSEFFIIKTKLSKSADDPRYGIVASKRTFKSAVDRNRAKRLLRDWIAFNENLMLPALDYIFIAQSRILGASRELGRLRMYKSFEIIAKTYRKYGNRK